MNKKHKIIIVDDHDMFREGVKVLLGKSEKIEFIGEAVNGEEFLKLIKTVKPDLVLMDIAMPVLNGIDATQEAVRQNPDIKILALSMFGEEEYYYKMIQAGVKGFVLKSSGIHELEHAIEEVAKGSSYFSSELLSYVLANIKDTNTESTVKDLTNEEVDMLKYLTKGMSDEDIASELNIQKAEVDATRKNLMKKTSCNNTAALVMFAIKNKIVSL
jgi:DNA-binding NarL/FixJ family response regulator